MLATARVWQKRFNVTGYLGTSNTAAEFVLSAHKS